jgi:hypothetical protein
LMLVEQPPASVPDFAARKAMRAQGLAKRP